jgi:hypothetical protein
MEYSLRETALFLEAEIHFTYLRALIVVELGLKYVCLWRPIIGQFMARIPSPLWYNLDTDSIYTI